MSALKEKLLPPEESIDKALKQAILKRAEVLVEEQPEDDDEEEENDLVEQEPEDEEED